jgi:adenylate cyclase, class 1
MNDIDKLIDSGRKAFTLHNRNKRRIMQMNDPLGARVVLNLVPLCLHVNHPDLPGYMGDDGCPCGVSCLEWPEGTYKSIESLFSLNVRTKDIDDLVPEHCEIEGLFTIGSVGSLGQTRESDYDIWVVVDANVISKPRLRLLERKLKLLKRWITSQYIMEVHFFLMDIGDIKLNNFGIVSQEGSGSALKNILKEEFYRTLTLIEGRIPLWWVIPPDNGNGTYLRVNTYLQNQKEGSAGDIIDMGNITSIPEEELFGGGLWQMHKALDDPLKSVLKMALMATYLDQSRDRSLLCEEIKRHVMDAEQDDIIDPYVEVYERVEDYYRSKGDIKTIELLRKCFYLKISPNIHVHDLLSVDRHNKPTIMVEIVKKWGWSIGYLTGLNRFHEWGVDKYRAFGDELHDYLKKTTVILIRRAKSFLINSDLDQDVEMEILRRRIEAFYVSKEGKIDPEKRVKKKEPAYEEIFFSYDRSQWSIHGAYPDKASHLPIMTADRVAKIIAWLAYNKRIDASTALHMVPNASRAALSDIQELIKDLNILIPDANSVGLDREALMEKKFVKQIVVIGNMEMPDHFTSIKEVDLLYINSWNEFFCIHVLPNNIRAWMKKNRTSETEISIWLPRDGKSKHLVNFLYSLFF